MSYSFKLARRVARFRAPTLAALMVAFGACSSGNPLNPDSSASTDPEVTGQVLATADSTQVDTLAMATPEGLSMASSFAGGIPMGAYALPTTWFGSRYNGGMRTLGPYELRSELAAIKSRGGKIVLMMAGSDWNYLDADGHFSLSMWKKRIDRFRGINFSSYVSDGTIIAHYLIDEPYDPTNYGGRVVPGSTLEEMAKYSKSIWPTMPTVVRAEPAQIKWSGTYQYLDAAWAQYLYRKGNVNDYISKNVADAQRMGLALIVGLNIKDGGNPNLTHMSASEVQSWGSTLLNSTYPCAFISWTYRDMSSYLSTSSMKSAMDALRRKAENRSIRSCRS
jgi:hypothetical protein